MRGSPFANHLFQTFRDSDKLYLQLEIKTSLYRLPENLAALELRFIGKVKTKRQARSNPAPTARTKTAPSLGQA